MLPDHSAAGEVARGSVNLTGFLLPESIAGGIMSQSVEANRPDSRRKWGVLAIISFSLFMILLDVTIVNIALPHIMAAFKVGLASIEWVFNIYTLVFAALLLNLGKLGDIFGRRLLFLIGLGIFTLASLGCSLAPSYNVLLVFRAIQAIGGAAMMPATLSILNVEFSQSQRGLALGIWGAVAGAANALGPIIGGALVDAASWRYIFVINIPVGIFAFIAALMVVRESKDASSDRRIDIPGVLIVSVALVCLTYALVEGQKYGWTSPTILALFAVALVSFIAFIFVELRKSSPLAQLRLFRDRTFASGNFIILVVTFGLIGVLYLLILFLQIILGFSALKAGLTLLPLPLAIMVAAPIAGRLTDKTGGRWILFAGTIIAAVGIYLMSNLSAATDWPNLMLPLAVCGIGMGLVMAPVTTVVMASTPVRQSGMGAGILSTVRLIGSVLGLSVLGAVLQNQLVNNISNALAKFPQIPAAIRDQIAGGIQTGSLSASGISVPSTIPDALKAPLISLFKEQFALSLNTTMKIGIIVIILGTVASLFISNRIRNTK
jgi:EmrB/QacA subfamily drug resistance transporter